MHPYIDLGFYELPSYSVMALLAFTAGLLLTVFLPSTKKIHRMDLFYGALYGLLGVFAGAKVLYFIVTFSQDLSHMPITQVVQYIANHRFDAVLVLLSRWFGGFVFYGGMIGGLIGILLYARQFHLKKMLFLESYVPAIPLIHGIARIGCFLAGCCYGRPTDSPIGVFFSSRSDAPFGIRLLPVQLFESLINLVIFLCLFTLSRKERRSGLLLGLYLMMYSVARFLLEFLRYDAYRGIFAGLSTSQWISIATFAVGTALVFVYKKKKDKSDIEDA